VGVSNQELALATLGFARMIRADLDRAMAGEFGALLTAGAVAAHLAAICPAALLAVAWRKACEGPPAVE